MRVSIEAVLSFWPSSPADGRPVDRRFLSSSVAAKLRFSPGAGTAFQAEEERRVAWGRTAEEQPTIAYGHHRQSAPSRHPWAMVRHAGGDLPVRFTRTFSPKSRQIDPATLPFIASSPSGTAYRPVRCFAIQGLIDFVGT